MSAPAIIRGFLNELLSKVTLNQVIDWVNNDKPLLSIRNEKYTKIIQAVGKDIGQLDWLTADWAITSIRKEHTALASLFVGWDVAYMWLNRQIAAIKETIES